ncbi:MAG: hypothetical protein OCC45_16080 [Desulfotalea sp.]
MKNYLPHDNSKKACNILLIFLVLILGQEICLANTQGEEVDLFGGFDDTQIVTDSSDSNSVFDEVFWNHFSGYYKLFTVANTTHFSPGKKYQDWYGLSGLKLEAVLEADFRISSWKIFSSVKGFYDFSYSINNNGKYTAEVLDTYRNELVLREAYLQGSISSYVDLKLGRQIVVWGRSDNFRVTDVLNPLDNRDPGLVDFENLRLPLMMAKTDIFLGNWNLDLILINEHRYNQNPPYGHFLYPYDVSSPPEEIPAYTIENSEIAVELTGIFNGWDISFYGASLFNDEVTVSPIAPQVLEHHKITMVGASVSVAQGNMLYIAELAHFRGLRFMSDYDKEYHRSDMLIGAEYSGFSDTIISIDYVIRNLHDYDSILDISPENPQSSEQSIGCRITSNFMQDKLQLTTLVIINGEWGEEGAMQRFTARYDIADNWSVTGGVLFFQTGNEKILTDDTGRVFLELRYDF